MWYACTSRLASGRGPRGEVVPVDHVAAVGRQRHAFAGLVVGRTGLGELPGHPAHLDHGQRGAVGEHHGHLQNGLDPGTDLVGRGCAEGLGTIPALEQEGLAIGGLGQTFAQDVDSPAKTSGGSVFSSATAEAWTEASCQLGCCTTGSSRQSSKPG